MKLTEEQKNKAIEFLSGFLNKTPCNACQGRDWILNDTIFELREFQGGGLVIGGKSSIFPVLTVICKTCGNTLFFNAIQLGLIKKEDEQPKR